MKSFKKIIYSIIRITLLSLLYGLFTYTTAEAYLKYYSISLPDNMMKGTQYVMTVTAYNDDGSVYTSGHLINFVLPAGLSLVETLPAGINGTRNFTLRVTGSATSGFQVITVHKQGDESIRAEATVEIENVIRGFDIQIVGGGVQKAGVEFEVDIFAKDEMGNTVQGFNGNINLSALVGELTVTSGGNGKQMVYGTTFINGVARIGLKMFGSDGAHNTLTSITQDSYLGAFASESKVINIEPNVFHHVLLIFPGELFAPGTGDGKSNSPLDATAGTPVDNVDVYLVDEWNNPVLSTDAVFDGGLNDIIAQFSKDFFNPVLDRLPSPITFHQSNHVQIVGDPFVFTQSEVSHTVTVAEDEYHTSDTSTIYVHPNSAASFNITLLAENQTTIDPLAANDPTILKILVKAIDSYGNTDKSFTGNANIFVNVVSGGGSIAEDAVHVDPVINGSFPYLNAPQNTIAVANGIWQGEILVSKAHDALPTNRVQIYALSEDYTKQGYSNQFYLTRGGVSNIWFELPNEEYTEGYYPGNDALKLPATYIAGQSMSDFTLCAVDKSWNTVPLGAQEDVDIVALTGYIDYPPAQHINADGTGTIAGIRLRTADPQTRLRARITAGPHTGTIGTSNPFIVLPGAYTGIVVIPPNQELIRGGDYDMGSLVGKRGTIVDQRVHQTFSVQAYLTDAFFNPVAEPVTGWPVIELYLKKPSDSDFVKLKEFTPSSSAITDLFSFSELGSHQIKYQQKTDPAKCDVVTINAIPGILSHFTVEGVGSKNAGDPMTIALTAYDEYDNPAIDFTGQIDLQLISDGALVSYAGVINPSLITFVQDVTNPGKMNVTVKVYYAGKSLGTGDDNLQIRVRSHSEPDKQGISASFNIYEKEFADILLILPGQTHQPGGTVIKAHSAYDANAGDPILTNLYAIDQYGNRVDFTGTVDLSLSDSQAFAEFNGSTLLSSGHIQKNISIYTAGSHTVNASEPTRGFSDASAITVRSGRYTDSNGKLLVLANGETHKPGSPIGKEGEPGVVEAHTELTLTVLACDGFYNIDTAFTGGAFALTSQDGAIDKNNIQCNIGKAIINGLFLRGGEEYPIVRVTVQDQNRTERQASTDIQVNPGAYFTISVPDQVLVGSPFSMTVNLLKPDGSMSNYNHAIYIEAVKPDGSPATILIAKKELVLADGSATEPLQHYDHVEMIQLKITDQFKRLGFSRTIAVIPNNLQYKIECLSEASVDDNFDMSIKLYDTIFDNHVITTMDHKVTISIEKGAGVYAVNSVTLHNGIAQFKQSYTKAEHIVFKANGTVGEYAAAGSKEITMLTGAYVKVQLVAPDEQPIPGVPSLTGKDSTLLKVQAAKQYFTVTVYAVDQYWNVVKTIGNVRKVKLTASDGSLAAYPETPFSSGAAALKYVRLNMPPTVDITAEDTAGDKNVDRVRIMLTGKKYRIIVKPNYPLVSLSRYITGKDFDIIVYLMQYTPDSVETEIVDPTRFTLVPVSPTLEPLDPTHVKNLYHQIDAAYPNMFETKPPLLGGGTRFTIQYLVAQDVILKAYDTEGWVGYSVNPDTLKTESIHFEPEKVYYTVELPQESVVGPPQTFAMKIIPHDINTQTIPINYASAVDITVSNISNPTNQFDGTLLVTRKDINSGAVELQQAFTRIGVVTLRVQDINEPTAWGEGSMSFVAGPFARVESNIPETIEAGTTREIKLSFYDQYDNPVKNTMAVLSLDDDVRHYQLGSLDSFALQSNALGTASVRLSTMLGLSGKLFFTALVGNFNINKVIEVVGAPTTTLTFGGFAVDTVKGHSIKQTDPIVLDTVYNESLVLDRVMYRIDDGEWIVYTGPFNINEVGIHTIEYYSVTKGELEHAEDTHHSLKVFVTQATSPDEGLVNYPNPFMAGKEPTFLEYYLSQNSNVTLTIYDVFGQKVYERDITSGVDGGVAGLNRIEWDGKNSDARVIANGGYICVLDIKDENRTLKRKIAVRK